MPACSAAAEKQLNAMKEEKIDFKMHSIYDIIYQCVRQILGGAI